MTEKTIILASGGTGGHIFPAESLAGELTSRDYRPVLVTDKRYHNYSDNSSSNLEVYTIRTGSLSGGVMKKISGVIDIGIGFIQAYRLISKLKPDVMVGFGGYPSFPTMYAGVFKRVKTIIHEQNSMLGQANFVLAPKVDAIATSFAEVSGISEGDITKVTLTGNPVRSQVKALREVPYPEMNYDGVLRILVTGGSQGASIFSDVVPEALRLLSPEFRKRIRIDQQCRSENIESVRAIYDEIGISSDLSTFFGDIPARLAGAHIVVARSGASTLAELTTVGRPVIMIPYKHAKDDHQTVNANALEECGGGWVIPEDAFTPQTLAEKLESFFALPEVLKEAASKARKAGKPAADSNLADLVESLIDG